MIARHTLDEPVSCATRRGLRGACNGASLIRRVYCKTCPTCPCSSVRHIAPLPLHAFVRGRREGWASHFLSRAILHQGRRFRVLTPNQQKHAKKTEPQTRQPSGRPAWPRRGVRTPIPLQCCPFPGIGPEAESNPVTLRINTGFVPE